MVQRIALGAPLGEAHRYIHGARLQVLVRHRERDEADALGLHAGNRLAQQQMVFGLGHAAEERPDDRRVIAGSDPEFGVPVDEAGRRAGDGDVGEKASASPAPTAAPLIAETTGLLQLIRL